MLRDQAFSFDAGICLVRAYDSVLEEYYEERPGYYPVADSTLLERLDADLRAKLTPGVTGDIRFGQRDGQNIGTRMTYVQFDTKAGQWRPVDYRTLFSKSE